MPSVVATWTGTCPLRPIVKELSHHLLHIGDIAYRHGSIPRLRPATRSGGARTCNVVVPRIPPPKVYEDVVLKGRIAVPVDALEPRTTVRDVIWLEEVTLNGVVLSLFDPRDLYPTTLSFVFATAKADRRVRGRLVEVVSKDPASKDLPIARMRDADHALLMPTVDLRYMYESWFDRLMAWVKLFYVGDLWYWRHDDLPGFADRAPGLFDGDRLETRQRQFDEIEAELLGEIAGWCR